MNINAANRRWPAFLAIIATMVFWGLSYVSSKLLLQTLSPFQLAAGRFALASALLLLWGLVTRNLRPIARQDWMRLTLSALIGIVVYFVFENTGLQLTTAGMGSLIIATIPVLNVMVCSIFLRRSTSPWVWLGVVLSTLGVFVIIRAGSTFSTASLWGNLLVLGAAFSWVAYTLLNQPLSQRYDAFSLNFYQTLIGTAILLLLTLAEGKPWPALSAQVLPDLLFLAACCSALGYIFYNYALRHLGSAVVTTFINFIPVFAVIGGISRLGEFLNGDQIIGGIIIIAGVTLVSRTDRKPVVVDVAEQVGQ